MHITAVTAPTRGPDYVAPVATRGTPSVTAPQPAPLVATEPSFTAATLAGDTMEDMRKRRASLILARTAPPPRYLAATRETILTVLEDSPVTHVSFRQAAQAYLAQRHAENDTPAPASPIIASVDERPTAPATPPEHPLPPSQCSEASTAGSLNMKA